VFRGALLDNSKRLIVSGDPNVAHREIQSHASMSIRRMTRLTNGFRKKRENHKAAISLQISYYNFCRIHQTAQVTPRWKRELRIDCGR
jgi:hypothetical protein